jgi:hypothetical protein
MTTSCLRDEKHDIRRMREWWWRRKQKMRSTYINSSNEFLRYCPVVTRDWSVIQII